MAVLRIEQCAWVGAMSVILRSVVTAAARFAGVVVLRDTLGATSACLVGMKGVSSGSCAVHAGSRVVTDSLGI